MRNVLTAIFLAISVFAKGQMWDRLARTDYSIDDGRVGTLELEIDNLDFFRDNEYNSSVTDGYTLPGILLTPKLVYTPHRQIQLELGAHALIFNGANKYPCYAYHDIGTWKGNQYQSGTHLLPWLRAKARFRHLTVVLGDIYGGQNHGFITPLFNTETNLSQDPEMGFQLLWDRKHLHSDTWLNWQSYIFNLDTHQEAFTVGSNWDVLVNEPSSRLHWSIPVQLVIQHRGGEQDVTNMGVQTISNVAIGGAFRWNANRRTSKRKMELAPAIQSGEEEDKVNKRALTHIGAEAHFLYSYQQSGSLWPFNGGMALHAAADVSLFNALSFKAGVFHAPDNFVSLYGNHFFSTLSTIDGSPHPCTTTGYLRADYTYMFLDGYAVGAEAELYRHRIGGKGETNFSFGIYFRLSPRFTLWRGKR